MARGTGTHLHEWIKGRVGVGLGGCGGCRQLLADMDAKPPQWTRDNLHSICKQIRNNLSKHPDWRAKILKWIPFTGYPIAAIVLAAADVADAELAAEAQAAPKQEA